jgi:hypothetical protein
MGDYTLGGHKYDPSKPRALGGYAWPIPEPVAAEEVRALREAEGLSMMEAKRRLQHEKEREAFNKLRTSGDLAAKIEWLLDRYAERCLPDRD